MSKVRLKTETIGVRMPPKLRYGIELLARKNGSTLSTVMVTAAERLLEGEGMANKAHGQLLSLLDRLWSESEIKRLEALQTHAPELATSKEKLQFQFLRLMTEVDSVEDFKSRFFAFGGPVDAINDLTDETIAELLRDHSWLRPAAVTPAKFREWLLEEARISYDDFHKVE